MKKMLPSTLLALTLATLASSRVIQPNIPYTNTNSIDTDLPTHHNTATKTLNARETKIHEIISHTPTPGAPFALPLGRGRCPEGYYWASFQGCAVVLKAEEGKMRGKREEDGAEGPRVIKLCCSGFWDCLGKWGRCKAPVAG